MNQTICDIEEDWDDYAYDHNYDLYDSLDYEDDPRNLTDRPSRFVKRHILPGLHPLIEEIRAKNGKDIVVFKQVPSSIKSDIIPNMQSLPLKAKELIMAGNKRIDYTSQCLIYNTKTGRADSWVPSISDVFAHDWELVAD